MLYSFTEKSTLLIVIEVILCTYAANKSVYIAPLSPLLPYSTTISKHTWL